MFLRNIRDYLLDNTVSGNHEDHILNCFSRDDVKTQTSHFIHRLYPSVSRLREGLLRG
jgi:hypothetical protein